MSKRISNSNSRRKTPARSMRKYTKHTDAKYIAKRALHRRVGGKAS